MPNEYIVELCRVFRRFYQSPIALLISLAARGLQSPAIPRSQFFGLCDILERDRLIRNENRLILESGVKTTISACERFELVDFAEYVVDQVL